MLKISWKTDEDVDLENIHQWENIPDNEKWDIIMGLITLFDRDEYGNLKTGILKNEKKIIEW